LQVNKSSAPPEKPRALIGWRLLGLLYDLWPVLALWMLLSAAFTLGYYLAGHGARENIPPFSPLQFLLWLGCWMITGAYAVLSWRRGGQTLGMRPWRLQVVSAQPGLPAWKALWLRYAVATLSLLLGGLGFWWAWVDREKLTWHDRASGTRMIRLPKRKA
jgi:RDD family.